MALGGIGTGNLLEAIVYLGKFPYTADTIFLGQRYPAPSVPLAYWPTLLVFQLTEIMLAGRNHPASAAVQSVHGCAGSC
jgi:hypothetical protein